MHGTLASAAIAVTILLGLTGPVVAEHTNGFDDNNNGQIDDLNEHTGGGAQPGGMEGECIATSRPEICLAYFQLNCQNGFALACAMADLGGHCVGGDPVQCQYFQEILQANTACYFGDQNACAYLAQQPVLQP